MNYQLSLTIPCRFVNKIRCAGIPERYNIELVLDDSDRETIFYKIWDQMEDDGLQKLLNAEGWHMVKL